MKFRKLLLVLIACCTSVLIQAQNKSEWTVLVYIQACNNLESFAQVNLRDMMKIGSNKNLSLLVELHRPGDTAWRYKVEKGKLVTEEMVSRIGKPNTGNELYSSVRWAKQSAPSEKFALILWNHATGPLDPEWNGVQPYYMKQHFSPRTIIDGITTKSRASENKLADDRGILFDEERRTYLTMPNMKTSFDRIKRKLFNGKKIDFIGMDACFMGSLEVAYQVKDFAKYFVGSSEFEFAYGWSYAAFLERLSYGGTSAEEVTKLIVKSYDNFYKNKTKIYTLSAVNLEHVGVLKDCVDQVCYDLVACKNENTDAIKRVINKARNTCVQFTPQHYIDLYTLFHDIKRGITNSSGLTNTQNIEKLKTSLTNAMTAIKHTVIANTTGTHIGPAQGLSVYFPVGRMDKSYMSNDFAGQSYWTDFIYSHINN